MVHEQLAPLQCWLASSEAGLWRGYHQQNWWFSYVVFKDIREFHQLRWKCCQPIFLIYFFCGNLTWSNKIGNETTRIAIIMWCTEYIYLYIYIIEYIYFCKYNITSLVLWYGDLIKLKSNRQKGWSSGILQGIMVISWDISRY